MVAGATCEAEVVGAHQQQDQQQEVSSKVNGLVSRYSDIECLLHDV